MFSHAECVSRQGRDVFTTQTQVKSLGMNGEGANQTTIRIHVRRVEIFMWEVVRTCSKICKDRSGGRND
jgi:hypothetical protein